MTVLLTPEQRQRAWRTAYLDSLDRHPDEEVAWEAEHWRELGALGIAALCNDLLHERRASDLFIPSETTACDLTALWQHVPQPKVLGLVRSGGQCLLAALRLVYWMGLTPEEIAA
jgi:hypothetical protein